MEKVKLLFLDIETTGLVPRSDDILEVAMCVTDCNMDIIDQIIVQISFSDPATNMNDFVRNMHTKSGLLSDIKHYGINILKAEEMLGNFVIKHFDIVNNEKPHMCGEGVHFDREFLKYNMPALYSLFHYRNIDTRTLRTFFDRESGIKPPSINNDNPHRALDDTIMAIDIYKGYAAKIKQHARGNSYG